MQSFKNERATHLLVEEINKLIVMQKIKDPRLSNRITILSASVSKDLTSATLYVSSFMDDKALQKSVDILNHAKGYIQSEIHKTLRWRNTPKLLFKLSHGLTDATHVYELLHNTHSTPTINTDDTSDNELTRE